MDTKVLRVTCKMKLTYQAALAKLVTDTALLSGAVAAAVSVVPVEEAVPMAFASAPDLIHPPVASSP